jgi:hypothetical protein
MVSMVPLHFFLCTFLSIQCARLFLQSPELGPPPPPPPHPQASVPPFGSGGTHSLAGEGLGWSQFGRGDRHCTISL